MLIPGAFYLITFLLIYAGVIEHDKVEANIRIEKAEAAEESVDVWDGVDYTLDEAPSE